MANHLLVVTGPTASGKTRWAIELAKHFATAVVSFDSRQLYREIAIGTAKPTPGELAAVPHYGINTHSITQPQSAASFTDYLLPQVMHLFSDHEVVVAVGGSGLYLAALLGRFDAIPAKDPTVRATLEERWRTEGLAGLLAQLDQLDPDYYATVDKQNPHRIIRALEVCLASGMPFSVQRKGLGHSRSFTPHLLGLDWPRAELYDRINNRVDQMLADGLVEEAKRLHPQRGLSSLETVGYSELFDYFEGKFDLPEAIRLIKRNTRRYAKRQLTWFRKEPDLQWFTPTDLAAAIQWAEQQID